MASTSTDGPTPVRRTRSANDVDVVAARQSSTSGGGGGHSRAVTLENGPLSESSSAGGAAKELEAVTSTTTILPTASSSGETTLNSSMDGPDPVANLNVNLNAQRPPNSGNQQAQAPTPAQAPAPAANNGSALRRFLTSIGVGRGASQQRKSQLSLVWNLCWGLAQVSTIATLVALSGTVWKSPTVLGQTEWEACDRPLGIWACMWAGRVVLASGLSYWDYKRTRARAALQRPESHAATDNPAAPPAPGTPPANVGGLFPLQAPSNTYDAPTANNQNTAEQVNLPYSLLYSRLTLFSSLITLTWFLTAHILEYTSLNTCRYASPHLWWLIFGILCIMYLMVLEVVLLGFIVLVVAPILFVFWNIFLFCIGRHPAQNPHMIKPDIGKLPKALVDRIPLVMYIPPPPTPAEGSAPAPAPESEPESKDASPVPSHEYPPTPASPQQQQQGAVVQPPKRNRFRFFKRKPSKAVSQSEHVGTGGDVDLEKGNSWEEQYEKGEYPFVVLEGNRAACAICLMDFEPPKKKDEAVGGTSTSVTSTTPPAAAQSPSSEVSELRLEDSGEGAQPLRLLGCGHVFHQTCLDPWLTDVSGRCPVCQRPVEESDLQKKKRNR